MSQPKESIAVRLERIGRVGLILLNEPETLNALSAGVKAGLVQGAGMFLPDADIGAIVIAGEGRAFCAGGDLRTMDIRQSASVLRRMQDAHEWLKRFLTAEKPILSAVHGVAAGAGFSLALMGDIVCAAENAKFKASFAGIGAAPDLALAYTLPRAIGSVFAKDILLTNREVSAQEAHRLGFVARLFPPDQLLPKTIELAQTLAAGPMLAHGLAKRLITRAQECSLETFLEQEALAQTVAFGSKDFAEGVSAFLAKRKPAFIGR